MPRPPPSLASCLHTWPTTPVLTETSLSLSTPGSQEVGADLGPICALRGAGLQRTSFVLVRVANL